MNFKRQLGFFNPEEHEDVTVGVIGCGGIGSFVIYCLASMGIPVIHVWDDDTVEEHNLPNQNFLEKHLGMPKVDAMADFVAERIGDGTVVIPHNERFTKQTECEVDILILATDSIESRTMAFKQAKKNKKVRVCHIVDGRLGGEMFQVFTCDMSVEREVSAYEDTLFEPSEAMELPCTARAVIYIGYEVAAHICRQVKIIITSPENKTRAMLVDHVGQMVEYNEHPFIYHNGVTDNE